MYAIKNAALKFAPVNIRSLGKIALDQQEKELSSISMTRNFTFHFAMPHDLKGYFYIPQMLDRADKVNDRER